MPCRRAIRSRSAGSAFRVDMRQEHVPRLGRLSTQGCDPTAVAAIERGLRLEQRVARPISSRVRLKRFLYSGARVPFSVGGSGWPTPTFECSSVLIHAPLLTKPLYRRQ